MNAVVDAFVGALLLAWVSVLLRYFVPRRAPAVRRGSPVPRVYCGTLDPRRLVALFREARS